MRSVSHKNQITPLGGEVLAFEMNPMQNLLHVVIGVGLMWAALRWRVAPPAVLAVAIGYLVLGIVTWSDGVSQLAMNPATARFHAIVGGLALLLLLPAVRADRVAERG